MLSLKKQQIFVKGLSLKYLEDSKEFEDMDKEQRDEYIRQYEVMKSRFYDDLEDSDEFDDEFDEEENFLTEEELEDLEREAMMMSAFGDPGEMTQDEILLALKGSVEAETKQESQIMEIFNCLNPFQNTSSVLADKLGIQKDQNTLISSIDIQGNSDSNKLSDIASNFNNLFNNFGLDTNIVESPKDIFDSITSTTESVYTVTPSAELSSFIYSISSESSEPNDYKQVFNNNEDILITEENWDPTNTFNVIIARYTTNDEIFFESWKIPDEYKKDNEINNIKDNIVDSLVGTITVENSLNNIENKNEDTIKLSLENSVELLKSTEVI